MMSFSRAFLPLFAAYCASYLVWYLLLGPGFKNYNLLDFSHYLNPQWLKEDLINSLLLLHSQPPLMNLLIGLVFKISETHYELTFRILYFAAGAVALWNMRQLFQMLGISRIISVLMFGCLLATPTFYMLGTWLGTTHIELCFVAVMLRYLAQYIIDKKYSRRDMVMVYVMFALLGLIRPQWHLLFFIGLTLLIAACVGRKQWKAILLCSLIFILPIGGWYAKNLYLFGFFGGSSWVGSNLSLVARMVAEENKNDGELVDNVSPDFPAQFSMPKVMRRVPPSDFDDLPSVLGPVKSHDAAFMEYVKTVPPEQGYIQDNFNYIGIIASSRIDMQDSLNVISAHPRDYVELVGMNILITSITPTYLHSSINLISLRPYLSPEIVLPTIYAAGILYGLLPLLAMAVSLYYIRQPQAQFILLCFAIASYVLLTSAAFNGYEGERIRWAIQPVYIIFAAVFMESIRRCFQSLRG